MDLYADDIKERLFVEVYNAKKLEGKLKNVVHECREDLVLVMHGQIQWQSVRRL